MKSIAVVQARMGSSRLPGKVLEPILGQPMVWHILNRLKHARHVQQAVLATTTDPSDDRLAHYAAQNQIGYHRGPVDDLAQRLLGAAQQFAADIIVRIWGDCPFIDPEIIDKGIEKLLADKLDFVSSAIVDQRTFPAGLDFEIYPRQTLEVIVSQSEDPFYREFPVEFILNHPDLFNWAGLRYTEDLSHIHLTVDYPRDLELARLIYGALHQPDTLFLLSDIVAFVTEHPELLDKTAHLPRNIEYFVKRKARGS